MSFSDEDFQALWLSLKLASIVTLLLLLIATPIALWLTNTQSRFRHAVNALVALPIVLPPTVIGFYLLVAMGPNGWIGQFTSAIGIGTLPFTFGGLVVASVIYSLPFVVQPIQNAIHALGQRPAEVAATLGAGPWDRFFNITLPLAKPGFVSAAVLGFAHTLGEFGVVLMIGGNIPGETKVLSVQIYDHVEALAYDQAHALAAMMVIGSFLALLLLYTFQPHNLPFKTPKKSSGGHR